MTASVAMFRDLMPEFATTADSRISSFITMAAKRVDSSVFGDLADYAVCYLAAHNLSLSGNGLSDSAGTAGPVSSESVGSVSVSYSGTPAFSSAANAMLMKTKYGQEYCAIRSERMFPVLVTEG